MTALILCCLFILPTGSIALDVRRDTRRRPRPAPARPKRTYEPVMSIGPAALLPHRPKGLVSLKAEIGRHRAPELKVRKAHPDWAWNTTEFEVAWDDFFAGQPQDQAVVYERAGAGR